MGMAIALNAYDDIFSDFDERRAHYRRENRRSKVEFLHFTSIGLALSFAANFFVDRFDFLPLFKDFLLIPAWFFVWSGLELFMRNRNEIAKKRKYYDALAAASVAFRDLEAAWPRGGGGSEGHDD
ncbi:MAG: hypothetical protein NT080_06240 [Spirochaetes bacterium]|nr:hypothetical protein [Spirochaetota bacterium]